MRKTALPPPAGAVLPISSSLQWPASLGLWPHPPVFTSLHPSPSSVLTTTLGIGFRAPPDLRWPHPRTSTGLHLQTPFFKQNLLYRFSGGRVFGDHHSLCTLTDPVGPASRLLPTLERAKSSVPGQLTGGDRPQQGASELLCLRVFPRGFWVLREVPLSAAGFQGVLGAALHLLVLGEVPH